MRLAHRSHVESAILYFAFYFIGGKQPEIDLTTNDYLWDYCFIDFVGGLKEKQVQSADMISGKLFLLPIKLYCFAICDWKCSGHLAEIIFWKSLFEVSAGSNYPELPISFSFSCESQPLPTKLVYICGKKAKLFAHLNGHRSVALCIQRAFGKLNQIGSRATLPHESN